MNGICEIPNSALASADKPSGSVDLTVSFRHARVISTYLKSFQNSDDRNLRLLLSELEAEKWPTASWNALGVAARIALIDHFAYPYVIMLVQSKGGI